MDHSHSHSHSHDPSHSRSTNEHHDGGEPVSYLETNRQYFNENAHKFEEYEGIREQTIGPANAMLKAYAFDKETTAVMEFACGTGLVAAEIAPFCKTLVGVDISQGVADVFNGRFKDDANVHAVVTELKGVEGEFEGAKFDVLYCSSAYHHFEFVDEVTRTLVFFLKPGGKLMVCDVSSSKFWDHISKEEHSKASKAVPHLHGISKEKIEAAMKGAGLVDLVYDETCCEVPRGNTAVQMFLAVGTKPANV